MNYAVALEVRIRYIMSLWMAAAISSWGLLEQSLIISVGDSEKIVKISENALAVCQDIVIN